MNKFLLLLLSCLCSSFLSLTSFLFLYVAPFALIFLSKQKQISLCDIVEVVEERRQKPKNITRRACLSLPAVCML
ncbi:hypothetical protein K1719_017673 [Acacia pycnantha]|nr:hypothetical protein K1719_017673 [Acacia pycnantha]